MITEPDVTLTDYGLAIECAMFAYVLYRAERPTHALRTWFVVFFVMGSVAALAGGTVHGFFHGRSTVGGRFLWSFALLAIGGSALAAWAVGARFITTQTLQRLVMSGAVVASVAYGFVVVRITSSFLVAVVNYLPALVFLTGTFVVLYARVRAPEVLCGVAGLLLMFVAAGIQWGGVALHPVYFNHNALYHVVQGVALALFFKAALWCIHAEQARRLIG